MSDSPTTKAGQPAGETSPLAVAAVVTSLAACYMDLVHELADSGHLDREKLAARLRRTAEALTRDSDSAGADLTRLIALGVVADLQKSNDTNG